MGADNIMVEEQETILVPVALHESTHVTRVLCKSYSYLILVAMNVHWFVKLKHLM